MNNLYLILSIITFFSCKTENLNQTKNVNSPCNLSEERIIQINQSFKKWMDCEDCLDGEWENINSYGQDLFCVVDFESYLTDSSFNQSYYEDLTKSYRILGGAQNKELINSVEFRQNFLEAQRQAKFIKLKSILDMNKGLNHADTLLEKFFKEQ